MNAAEKHAILRILDANFNRAREALRVVEEAARFHLDEPYLVERIKNLRHRLTGGMAPFPPEELLSARDTAGDVGTGITADAETRRTGIGDILRSAFGRLSEALRVLEEYAKPLDARAGAQLEAIPYEAYQAEKALDAARRSRERLAGVRLCVLLTEGLCKRPV
ncbi:MAG: thiamine phosphate synthase, partial [Planctomycetia bacterium]|nr:thiamine phosphate synthase [Planctomycetia bacterium]